MKNDPDNHTLRLLADMRAEHAATREAVEAHMRAIGRMPGHVCMLVDRLDQVEARLLNVQAETGKTLRSIQSDVIAMEDQNIARHGETINLMHRMRAAEDRMDELPAA